MGQFTNRNHYNPCFWTALWNEEFYSAFTNGHSIHGAREQVVCSLNIRGDCVFETSVERIHCEKGLGVAEITPESAIDFCRRHYPAELLNIQAHYATNPENIYMDFEDFLTGIESLHGYDALMRAAKIGTLESPAHRGFLAISLVMQAMRSHEFMFWLQERAIEQGIAKWEAFWHLRNRMSNRAAMARATLPLARGTWTFWRTDKHTFPLCDSPVMIERDSLMAVLSPRLLLEIVFDDNGGDTQWAVINGISEFRLENLRQRSLMNTFREVIFPTTEPLKSWQASVEYQTRREQLRDKQTRIAALRSASSKVLYAMNGFGRVGPDFEKWIEGMFDRPEVKHSDAVLERVWKQKVHERK